MRMMWCGFSVFRGRQPSTKAYTWKRSRPNLYGKLEAAVANARGKKVGNGHDVHGYIAQWLERLTADQQVPGSNPGVPFARYSAPPLSLLFCRFTLVS